MARIVQNRTGEIVARDALSPVLYVRRQARIQYYLCRAHHLPENVIHPRPLLALLGGHGKVKLL